jgi:spore coat polysaccharide biosynthesis protein SpsF
MNVLVVVQARMGSSRLPGKVLLPLSGAPMLQRQIERIQAARTAFALAVATTTSDADQPIRDLCAALDVACFSGHPTDLLDRHYQAAIDSGADAVVKIPSDCPLIDPAVIDRVIRRFLESPEPLDYASNLHPASNPDGNDVEILSMEALSTAWKEATRPHEREHTTPFVWDQPHRFRLANVRSEAGIDMSMTLRFTVDYPADYRFVTAVYEELYHPSGPVFSLAEILALLARRPELRNVNAMYSGVNWYRHHLRDLQTVSPRETRECEASA